MRTVLLSTVVAFSLAATRTARAESAAELLARLDARRDVPDMSFVMQITSYEDARQKDANTLWGFVKTDEVQNRTLVSFAEPASVKGRKMLMDGNTVYLLFPRTKNPIRLSPLQVLMGEASNGDVARTGFSQDYDPAAMEDDSRDGVACLKLTLNVKESKKDSTYKKVLLWVEKSTLHTLYAEFFTSGDKLLKRAYYRDFRRAEGKEIPFVLDIFDGENPQKHTVMEYKKVGRKPVPVSVFRRDYLEAWTPEQPR
jgi:hypothetical protein